MNVTLEPEDYRKLIELAYLGEWMVNAQHDPDFHDEQAQGLVQKLISTHPLDEIEKDDETGEFYITSAWIERMYDQYILDYDDHVFWDELTERLAQRDLAKLRGVPMDEVNREDDLLELKPLEQRYHEELEEHGVEHLELKDEYS